MLRIAVIGGGPAGLFAAIRAAKRGARVSIIEKMKSPGRKLLISGSGQCNLSHAGEIEYFLSRYGEAGRFLRPALFHFSPRDLLRFFEDRGVSFETEEGGKIFPKSRRARDILQVLLREIEGLNVQLLTASPVSSVGHGPDGFTLTTSMQQTGSWDRVIIAAGGASYPATGSDGSGFSLAAQLGHSIVEPRPALTDVAICSFRMKELAGISIKGCCVLHFRGDKLLARLSGDLLITHTGFSGPVIMDASRNIRCGDTLVPDFGGLGSGTADALRCFAEKNGKKQIKSVSRLLACPEALLEQLLSTAGIEGGIRLGELSREKRRHLAETIAGSRYTVASTGDFRDARVTAGGVDRREINPKNMESRILPGLFFAGEVMDIDGDTGGFNLQAAFSTGALAGDNSDLKDQ
ncbi:NAD(P)/FAD-dependent oxidoreductase [Marispirochaeta sp.]|jgi:predicted Rossmann fold flavoprotein|uniref:NAD(P)/FAD-dependent oxidoreductase n=1 Tax=Marispirochaeta sp. TaxID=2038653 RepID=UPI0029C677EB|nr:NAD(P)/FAD-dependent oxidoreductase [Marispirochaeta sp.]